MKIINLIQEVKRCDNCGRKVDEITSRDCIARDEKRNINERLIFCKKLKCIFDYQEKHKGVELKL